MKMHISQYSNVIADLQDEIKRLRQKLSHQQEFDRRSVLPFPGQILSPMNAILYSTENCNLLLTTEFPKDVGQRSPKVFGRGPHYAFLILGGPNVKNKLTQNMVKK